MENQESDSWEMLQDCVVFMTMKGFDTKMVIDMDMLSFNELLESVNRLDAIEKADTATANFVASQAEGKEVKKWIKEHYLNGISAKGPKPVRDEEFKKLFGGGF